MKFNTAILYDIENLIGGYGKSDMLASLSLKDIFNEIKKKETGKIAIQRAYANWSDPRLNILRGDIVELGIEPIQMFGFGKGSQKNASDIQLAIDAIDIAYTKSAIEVFVIVSGDGGFSFLAKKLHEYGKMVIGCAFKRTTNKVFEAVCDDFIWIEEPKDELLVAQTPNFGTSLNNDPIVLAFIKKYQPIQNPNRDKIIEVSREIFNFLSDNRDAVRLLSNEGLNISVLSQLLNYRFSGFNYFQLGFVKFTDFIRFASYQTNCKLVYKAPSEYRLVLTTTKLIGYDDLDYITDLGQIHSTDNYKKILEKGPPTFKQFNKETLFTIAEYLADNKIDFQKVKLGDIIDKLSDLFDLEQAEIKSSVMTLIAGECFMRVPEDVKLSEQELSFIPQNAQQAIISVERVMKIKLENILGEIEDNIFNQIWQ